MKAIKKCLHQIFVVCRLCIPEKSFNHRHKCIPCSFFYFSHRARIAFTFNQLFDLRPVKNTAFYFAQLSHKHKKHRYFVYPPCCPSKKFIIFRSTHMTHLWSSYWSKSNTSFHQPSINLPSNITLHLIQFPSWSNTHFRLFFELSTKSLHSLGSYWGTLIVTDSPAT